MSGRFSKLRASFEDDARASERFIPGSERNGNECRDVRPVSGEDGTSVSPAK